jgi:hypothetical protein
LRRRVGARIRITIVSVDQIPRTARGKLRTVVNLVSNGAALIPTEIPAPPADEPEGSF